MKTSEMIPLLMGSPTPAEIDHFISQIQQFGNIHYGVRFALSHFMEQRLMGALNTIKEQETQAQAQAQGQGAQYAQP